MRKPLLALGLAVSTSLGVFPAAGTLAATPVGSSPRTSPTGSPSVNSFGYKATSRRSPAVSGAAIVQTAMQYIGYPYTATGNSPSTGFSCIGFVSYVYRQNGIPLPGDLGGALNFAPEVPFSSLMPGDILYFANTVWNGLSHAAIYIGGGKFVHAEWYGYGVRVSSFTGDARDGNYWTRHYLTANRPWTGPAVAPIIGTNPGNSAAPVTTTAPQTTIPNGPSAVVTAPSLNVRMKPSMSARVLQVVPRGTSLSVLGKSHGWYKVSLPDGTVGWAVASYMRLSGSPSTTGTTGNPSAPARQGYPSRNRTLGTVAVSANGLMVHSGPSASAPVITTAYRGQRLPVLAKRYGWLKIRMPSGIVGWISAAYTSARTSSGSRRRTGGSSSGGSKTAQVATNVRSGPSMQSSIITVLPVGGKYRILGWSNGFAHVQLSNGTIGWISGTVIGGTGSAPGSSTTYRSRTYQHNRNGSRTKTSFRGGSVLTAGVRVHSRPGINSPVIGMAAAGTRVQVLGYSAGWARIRTAGGMTGYVLGSYVR